MATLVLGAVGAAAGSSFGGVGAILGRAAGAFVGHAVDQRLFGESDVIEGPRLTDLEVQSSTEGLPIARVYGRARIAGQIIWATDFVEQRIQSAVGGKGSGRTATVIDYIYFANFAVALCEGPITRIDRVWADGVLLDEAIHPFKVYLGTRDQERDSTLSSLQQGDVPAYRNLAYVVFERLSLEDFGNRIPQLSFEVVRNLAGPEDLIKAAWLAPGTMEFGLDTAGVTVTEHGTSTFVINKNADTARTDWTVSLDELQTTAPNLEWVVLSVAWFGSDLRAHLNRFTPRVEHRNRDVTGRTWRVAGVDRSNADTLSIVRDNQLNLLAAFAGTPDDQSFRTAIDDLKQRGLKICLAPTALMDIPANNRLPNPSHEGFQPAYPGAGDITCDPAPGRPQTVDGTDDADYQIEDFLGHATVDGIRNPRFPFPPTQGDARYRHLVLHYAVEADRAGGVDALLIGSGLSGLTSVRSSRTRFPFVEGLRDLAREARKALPDAAITYAADWADLVPIRPAGTDDLIFNLDPLWADPDIDAVAINYFPPLSDWREEDGHLDSREAATIHDATFLRRNMSAGEGFDWTYQSDADRDRQQRTPISDPAAAKPWVFRPKDLRSWWENPHFDRFDGAESSTPTAWMPKTKPIWLTQLGCPAIDKGANQPGVFRGSRGQQDTLPPFSDGTRDDQIQRSYLDAVLGQFDPAHPDFADGNPHSDRYAGRMVDPAHMHVFAWDMRPYPAFPQNRERWSDHESWARGHLLNGRMGSPDIKALITAILADYGFSNVLIENAGGPIAGYVITEHVSARRALEPLLKAFLIEASEHGSTLLLRGRARSVDDVIVSDDLVDRIDEPLIEVTRTQDSELPSEVMLRIVDPNDDYRVATASARRPLGHSRRVTTISLPLITATSEAARLTDNVLADVWTGRESFAFSLGRAHAHLEAGDLIRLRTGTFEASLLIQEIADRGRRIITARRAAGQGSTLRAARQPSALASPLAISPAPIVHVLDVPLPGREEAQHAPRLAITTEPWPGTMAIFSAFEEGGFQQIGVHDTKALTGETLSPLGPGPVGVFDRINQVDLRCPTGELSYLPEIDVLGGGNLAAIQTPEGRWEVLQFADAELIGPDRYRISALLRGHGGTEREAAMVKPAGSAFIMIDKGLVRLPIPADSLGMTRRLRVGPARHDFAGDNYTELTVTPEGDALRPYAPVHLCVRRDEDNDDLHLSWIRRTRTGGDSWHTMDVPLGEEIEAYQLEILRDGQSLRTFETSKPAFTYRTADQRADFGEPASQFVVRIAQISLAAGPGALLEEIVNVPL